MLRKQLSQLTEILLNEESSYIEIRNACIGLSGFFTELISYQSATPNKPNEIITPSGKAIGTEQAIMCINDMMRTCKFLRGIRAAINEKLEVNHGEPVKILYAGSGPFATLFTPLINYYSPSQVKVLLIEINKESVDILRKMVPVLGMEKYIEDIVEGDAVSFTIPSSFNPDIIISETMNAGLAKEPQVSVVSHLLSQCNDECILIPEKIEIDLCLTDCNVLDIPAIFPLQKLLILNKETAVQINRNPELIPLLNEGIRVVMPDQIDPVYRQIHLQTMVNVYRNHTIALNEAGITLPVPVCDVNGSVKFPAVLVFRYQISAKPGFEFEIIEEK